MFTGGSTALMRDTKKMIAIGPATPIFSKSQIQVYSPSGEGLLLLSVRVDCPVHAHIFIARAFSGNKPKLSALAGQATKD
jgi:hypothetical protein